MRCLTQDSLGSSFVKALADSPERCELIDSPINLILVVVCEDDVKDFLWEVHSCSSGEGAVCVLSLRHQSTSTSNLALRGVDSSGSDKIFPIG